MPVEAGAKALARYLDDPKYARMLRSYKARASPLASSSTASLAYLARQLNFARRFVEALRNDTQAAPGILDLDLSVAFAFVLMYYIKSEAMRDGARISQRGVEGLLRLENALWASFVELYRTMFGRADFCRCMEGEPWYANVGAQLRDAVLQAGGLGQGFGALAHVLRGSSATATFAERQRCQEMADSALEPAVTMQLLLTTGCASGDIAAGLMQLQCFIMEHDVVRTLQVMDSLFRLATLAFSCHDAEYWQFRLRDVAIAYAGAAWEIARHSHGQTVASTDFVRQLARVAERGSEELQPWRGDGCGPHDLGGPLRVGVLHNRSDSVQELAGLPTVGPVCMEFGKFWLLITTEPVRDAPKLTLAVIPISYFADPNPWHNSHWWIPALWYLRLELGLEPGELQLALAFPPADADFPAAVRSKVSDLRRTELPAWSYLQSTWPEVPSTSSRRLFQPGGLHEEVLALLSTRGVRPLRELHGRRFRRVIVGVPSMRWTVHTPQLHCPQLRAVGALVQGSARYRALEGDVGPGAEGRPPLLRLVQRAPDEGRVVVNLPEVVDALARSLGDAVRLEVVETRRLRRASWTEQFRVFATANAVAGAEGAALSWLWALPRGGAVVELRAYETPAWNSCSGRWDDAAHSGATFPGLAQLAGVHHICVRMQRSAPPRASEAEVAAKALQPSWKARDILWDADAAVATVREALRLLAGPAPPCNTRPSWISA